MYEAERFKAVVDQDEIHRMVQSEDVEERKETAEQLRDNFACLPDKKQAWEDLIRLTSDNNRGVRERAAYALGSAYYQMQDKKQAWEDLIRLTSDNDSGVRWRVAYALGSAFYHMQDKKQAWEDLIRLTSDNDSGVRRGVAYALGSAFYHMQDKKQAWEDLIRLTSDNDSGVRWRVADTLRSAFSHVPDKKQAWEDLHRLTSDNDSGVRWRAADTLRSAFSHVPDKKQAWIDLIRLTSDNDNDVRWHAVDALGNGFFHVPNKKQAWEDLHRLTSDSDSKVRWRVADTVGSVFSHVPDKKQAWKDLHRLTSDNDTYVRATALHSSGRVSIFRAGQAENDEHFRKELETALGFFEKASKEVVYFGPSRFCLPFYRSFYALTFRKKESEAEVKNLLSEARSAVEGSESKEKLLEAVENLSNALREVEKAKGLDERKFELNAYRRYCERACELLDKTEEKAPGATWLIKKGLPIIDEKIKVILAEIQENATALCKQTKGTPFQALGKEVDQIGKTFPHINDPIRLEKSTGNMMIVLSQICAKLPEGDRGDACELLKKAKEEPYVEDRLDLINMVLSKIPPQIGVMKKTIIVNQYGNGDRFYNESVDNSINISGDLATDLVTLSDLIKRDYNRDDKGEILKAIEMMKKSCNNQEKKGWLKEKLGWLVTRTSEVASISSFALTLLDKLK